MDRLAAALEKEALSRSAERENRRVEVVVAILGLRVRKIGGIESEIRGTEREEEEFRNRVAFEKSAIEEIEERARAKDGQLSEGERVEKAEAERRVRLFEASTAKAGERKLLLQNDLAAERRRLAGLEAVLEDWLQKLR